MRHRVSRVSALHHPSTVTSQRIHSTGSTVNRRFCVQRDTYVRMPSEYCNQFLPGLVHGRWVRHVPVRAPTRDGSLGGRMGR